MNLKRRSTKKIGSFIKISYYKSILGSKRKKFLKKIRRIIMKKIIKSFKIYLPKGRLWTLAMMLLLIRIMRMMKMIQTITRKMNLKWMMRMRINR